MAGLLSIDRPQCCHQYRGDSDCKDAAYIELGTISRTVATHTKFYIRSELTFSNLTQKCILYTPRVLLPSHSSLSLLFKIALSNISHRTASQQHSAMDMPTTDPKLRHLVANGKFANCTLTPGPYYCDAKYGVYHLSTRNRSQLGLHCILCRCLLHPPRDRAQVSNLVLFVGHPGRYRFGIGRIWRTDLAS